MQNLIANLFVLAGLLALIGAAWLLHPAAGLATFGGACLAVGLGRARIEHVRDYVRRRYGP